MHRLGAVGNFAISDTIQSVLTNYGLEVDYDGAGGYGVTSPDGSVDIEQLCPASIKRDGHVFDIDNLRRFGEFLHQPIRRSLEQTLPVPEKLSGFRARSQQRAGREAIVHEKRASIHRMLRFAATGSVEIPPDNEEALDKDSAECHAETEQAMRDADTWKSEIEFGNSEQKISSLPHTSFDAQKGFILKLAAQNPQEMAENQRALDDTFWSLVNEVSNGRYLQAQTEISLSGAELENFSMLANEVDLGGLIDRVEFEEAVQEKLISIKQRMADLSGSSLLRNNADKSEQLHALMTATSALTPILGEDFMRDAWAKYNFTARHASPFGGLQKEMAVFLSVAQTYMDSGQMSAVQMEAIATEFYSLIAFSGHMIDAFDDGLAKQIKSGVHVDDAKTLKERLPTLKNTFDNASVAGVSLDADFLSDEQRNALETLQKYAGKPESFGSHARAALNAPVRAGADTFVDFSGDVINFIREDPKIAAGFVALAGTLIMMQGGNPADAADAAYSVGLAVTDDGELASTAINADHIPRDLFGNDNFHWDLKFSPLSGYELYKHFANSNFIVGPSQQFMEWTRSSIHGAYGALGIAQNYESAYDSAATRVIQPLSDKLFAVNMFQNVSHAAFWMWAGARGYQHGTKGFGKIMELSAPVVDFAYQGGSAIPEAFKKKTAFSDHLMRLAEGPLKIDYSYDENPSSLIDVIAQAADVRADFEGGVQDYAGTLNIDAMKVPFEADGLKRSFNIHARNFQPTLDAITKFDHFMQQVGLNVASHEAWHVKSLIAKVGEVQNALLDYQKSGDATRLEQELDAGLEYVLASELRYRDGQSGIYEALFEAAPDRNALKRLMRSAHTTIGRERRSHAKDNIQNDIIGAGEAPLKLTEHGVARTKLAGINLWGAMVGGAKAARRITDRTINKRNVIVASGVAATCVGLDMAGAGNEFSDAVSGLTGGALATGATTATFLNFNFWEDVVGVHLGTGISLIFGGAAAGFAHKKYIRPITCYAAETQPGKALANVLGKGKKAFCAVVESVSDGLDDYNVKLGAKATAYAQSHSYAPNFR